MANKLLVNRIDKRVTIVNPYGPPDDYGEPTEGPVTVATVWAGIEPLRGQDRYAAQQENAEVTTRIRIRYREGIDRTMIVQYQGITFEILYIIRPSFGKTELQLMCKERQ